MVQKSASLRGTVAVQEVPMCEVVNYPQLDRAIERIFNEGLTGFVMRATGLLGTSMDTHDAREEIIIDALNRNARHEESSPYQYEAIYHLMGITARNAQKGGRSALLGIGRLHDDKNVSGSSDVINLHTTFKGAGKVILANSGPGRGNYQKSASLSKAEHAEMAELLIKGLVNPELVLPEMQTTELFVGDSVVFPLNNIHGPVLHRFDTSIEPRDAEVTLFKPYEPKK